jgi:hypothetical protein
MRGVNQPPQPPEPAVVEWGSERRGLLDRLVGARGWHPAIPRVLAGLGALAMFGSLIGEWQVVEQRFTPEVGDDVVESQSLGIGVMFVWGMGWLVGAMLLGVCTVLALTGQPPIRRHARAIGLAVAAVQLGILAGAVVNLNDETVFGGVSDVGVEISLGRGLYAAFASVLLIAAALYLARMEPTPRQRPASDQEPPASVDGPADLVVGPAEPMVRPTDTLQG